MHSGGKQVILFIIRFKIFHVTTLVDLILPDLITFPIGLNGVVYAD